MTRKNQDLGASEDPDSECVYVSVCFQEYYAEPCNYNLVVSPPVFEPLVLLRRPAQGVPYCMPMATGTASGIPRPLANHLLGPYLAASGVAASEPPTVLDSDITSSSMPVHCTGSAAAAACGLGPVSSCRVGEPFASQTAGAGRSWLNNGQSIEACIPEVVKMCEGHHAKAQADQPRAWSKSMDVQAKAQRSK